MRGHVVFRVPLAHPVQGCSQIILSLGRSRDKTTPFVDIGIIGIGELFFRLGDERTGINGIECLLVSIR